MPPELVGPMSFAQELEGGKRVTRNPHKKEPIQVFNFFLERRRAGTLALTPPMEGTGDRVDRIPNLHFGW